MEQKQLTQLENLKNRIDREGATIKFISERGFKVTQSLDLENFIYKIIYGTYRRTEEIHQTIKTRAIKNRYRQQSIGHSRSLGDLYMICKYYYPETTIENVVEALQKLMQHKKIRSSYCSTFRARMFQPGNNYGHSYTMKII